MQLRECCRRLLFHDSGESLLQQMLLAHAHPQTLGVCCRGIKLLPSRQQQIPVADWSPPAVLESSHWERLASPLSPPLSTFLPPPSSSADKPLRRISEFLDEWENNRSDRRRWPCDLSLCYIYANELRWWRGLLVAEPSERGADDKAWKWSPTWRSVRLLWSLREPLTAPELGVGWEPLRRVPPLMTISLRSEFYPSGFFKIRAVTQGAALCSFLYSLRRRGCL